MLGLCGECEDHASHVLNCRGAKARKSASIYVVVSSLTRDRICLNYIEGILSDWRAKQPTLNHMCFFKHSVTFNIGWKLLDRNMPPADGM